MAKISTMTSAPIEIELGGVKYKLSPLNHRALGELERWMQERLVDVAKRAAADMSPADRQAVLSDAVNRAATIDLTSPEAGRLMATMEGACRMLWLGMRPNHPDVTLERVHDLLADPATLDAAMAALDSVNDLVGTEGKAKPGK